MLDKEELIGQLDRWIRGEKGGKYACGRGYANKHDDQCACCLLIAARDALKSSAQETRACNACVWTGLESDTVHPKHSPEDRLCPECHETTAANW